MRFFVSLLLIAVAFSGCADDAPASDSGAGASDPTGGQAGSSSPSGSGAVLIQAPADPPVGTTWSHKISGPASGTSESELVSKGTKSGHTASEIHSVIQSSGSTTEADSWTRISDGAVIEAHTTTDAPYIGTVDTTTTFDPPCTRLQYPVRAGDSYEITCHGEATTSFGDGSHEFEQTVQVDVQGKETITVPAGTFETVHVITTVDGHETHEYYLLDGCGSALSIVEADGNEVRTELTATTC